MMPYQSYQLWDTERVKSARDWQAADRRTGELAAALSGLLHRGPPGRGRHGGGVRPAARQHRRTSAISEQVLQH